MAACMNLFSFVCVCVCVCVCFAVFLFPTYTRTQARLFWESFFLSDSGAVFFFFRVFVLHWVVWTGLILLTFMMTCVRVFCKLMMRPQCRCYRCFLFYVFFSFAYLFFFFVCVCGV